MRWRARFSFNQKVPCVHSENANHFLNEGHIKRPASCVHKAAGQPLSLGPGSKWRIIGVTALISVIFIIYFFQLPGVLASYGICIVTPFFPSATCPGIFLLPCSCSSPRTTSPKSPFPAHSASQSTKHGFAWEANDYNGCKEGQG